MSIGVYSRLFFIALVAALPRWYWACQAPAVAARWKLENRPGGTERK